MKYPISRPTFGAEERELLLEAFDSSWVTTGPMVKRFEEEFAAYLGVPYAVATPSGTSALHLALAALGIKRGDEVIVPDLTYVATANAVTYVGARPIFVDIDATTYCLDVEQTANAITSRTRAIMPVHLYGHAVDMSALHELVSGKHIRVIEDAAEGLGGHYGGPKLGTMSDVGCFSFFGNKVMTTGEGGMAVTHEKHLADRLRLLHSMANHLTRRYFHTEVGFNYRMTDLQAALGIGQLHSLPQNLAARREVVSLYMRRLSHHNSLVVPSGTAFSTYAPWLFTLELPEGCSRDGVMTRLAEAGIETRPTFVPMHEIFDAYHGRWPVSTRVAARGISLPTYVGLTPDDVDFICSELLKWI